MAESYRCGKETDQRTLNDEPLCLEYADWDDNHDEMQVADQHGLGK